MWPRKFMVIAGYRLLSPIVLASIASMSDMARHQQHVRERHLNHGTWLSRMIPPEDSVQKLERNDSANSSLRIGIDVHSIGSKKGGNETYYR